MQQITAAFHQVTLNWITYSVVV